MYIMCFKCTLSFIKQKIIKINNKNRKCDFLFQKCGFVLTSSYVKQNISKNLNTF